SRDIFHFKLHLNFRKTNKLIPIAPTSNTQDHAQPDVASLSLSTTVELLPSPACIADSESESLCDSRDSLPAERPPEVSLSLCWYSTRPPCSSNPAFGSKAITESDSTSANIHPSLVSHRPDNHLEPNRKSSFITNLSSSSTDRSPCSPTFTFLIAPHAPTITANPNAIIPKTRIFVVFFIFPLFYPLHFYYCLHLSTTNLIGLLLTNLIALCVLLHCVRKAKVRYLSSFA